MCVHVFVHMYVKCPHALIPDPSAKRANLVPLSPPPQAPELEEMADSGLGHEKCKMNILLAKTLRSCSQGHGTQL